MIITNCPKCGSMNITTAGVCANCGWSQFAQVTKVSTPIEDALQAENERLKEELQQEKTRSQLNLEAEERRMLNITYYRAEIDRLTARITELEAAQRWIPVSERLPNKSGWYLTGLVYFWGSPYSGEVYFDAETELPWRNSVRDEVYCWLDGVPELPKPPEVQE